MIILSYLIHRWDVIDTTITGQSGPESNGKASELESFHQCHIQNTRSRGFTTLHSTDDTLLSIPFNLHICNYIMYIQRSFIENMQNYTDIKLKLTISTSLIFTMIFTMQIRTNIIHKISNEKY